MKRLLSLGWLAAMAALPFPETALAQHAEYDALVATHAKANGVPEALVHRVIVRESRYQPGLVGRGGTIGLMQIKLATARGLGYTGDAAGLRDPNTNLTYAVKYLARRLPRCKRRLRPRRPLFRRRLLLRRQTPAAGTWQASRTGARRRAVERAGQGNDQGCRRQRRAGFQIGWSKPVQTGNPRVDTLPHRPTLALFRGELR